MSNLSFSYKGTDLPTQEMKEWFDYEYNQPPCNMDDLEQDEFESKLQKDFFDEFRNELMDLSFMQMIDVFNKSK